MTKAQGIILMTRNAVTGFESLGAQMSRAQRYLHWYSIPYCGETATVRRNSYKGL